MATIGRNRAIAVLKGFAIDGFLAWLIWAVVHIYALIGFRNRVAVMLQWFWAYLTRQRTARLITEGQRSPVVDVLIREAPSSAARESELAGRTARRWDA